MQPYPAFWPLPNAKQPTLLQSRITEQEKLDLYNRVITTRDLAKKLGVHERYLSSVFPHKVPIVDKRELAKVRKDFRMAIAAKVVQKALSVKAASEQCHVSLTTMNRYIKKHKESKGVQNEL